MPLSLVVNSRIAHSRTPQQMCCPATPPRALQEEFELVLEQNDVPNLLNKLDEVIAKAAKDAPIRSVSFFLRSTVAAASYHCSSRHT
jgi:hypothetical protein